MDQQRTLEKLESVAIDPPGARGRQLGDEWRDRIGDQTRQRAETGRVFAAIMLFAHSVALNSSRTVSS